MFDLIQPDQTPSIGTATQLDPVTEFRLKVDTNSPQPVIAYLFIGLNVAFFLVMLLSGVSLDKPRVASLISWGANYGPLTISHGEWWRLLTAMFMHIGILHLAFNMFVLFKAGPFIETLLGYQGFFILYMASGLAGGFLSLAVHPFTVSAGASGAIFGLYGALVAILWVRGDAIPLEVVSPLTRSALLFLGINLVYGLVQQGTDLAAHIGGLVAGFACGYFIGTPLTFEGLAPRATVHAAVAGTAAALFIGTAFLLPRPSDLQAELKQFNIVETNAIAGYKSAVSKAHGKLLGNAVLADQIQKELIPPWAAEHHRLAALKGLPDRQQRIVSLLMKYMEARQQAWTLLAAACRNKDLPTLMSANLKNAEAQKFVADLKNLPQ